MEIKFVPDDFMIPQGLENSIFRLRMLSSKDVEKDYEAVMSSRNELRNPLDEHSWPREDMTLEEDLEDLKVHEREFLTRQAFTYTVMNLDESLCLGCVYIYPSMKKGFEAEIYLWVRTSELKNGLDEFLYKTVDNWVASEWPFKSRVYPGRSMSWDEWRALEKV